MDTLTMRTVEHSTPAVQDGLPDMRSSGPHSADCSCPTCRRAFAARATMLEPILVPYISRMVANPADVRDLMQETYVRLLAPTARSGNTYTSAEAMVKKVAHNVTIDWLRHRAIVTVEYVSNIEALDIIDERGDCEDQLDAQQQLALVTEAVQQLPERCRQVFTLRKVYGYSQKEIAFALGISENTVEQHLTKATQRLAARFPDLAPTYSRARRNRMNRRM